MGKIIQRELDKMLELHKLWLYGDIKGIRLDLSNEDVYNLNMQGAYM